MRTPTSLISWIFATSALISWILVAYVAWSLYMQAQIQATDRGHTVETARQKTRAIHQASLARALQQDSTRLDALAATDIVTIVTMISDSGRAAHVPLFISDAAPAVRPTAKGKKQPALPDLRAYDISAEATGSFNNIIQMMYAIENIPALSSIVTFDLQRQGGTKESPQWHINARIRVFSNAPL